MFVNNTSAPIILGRFRILPGAKIPAVPLTDQEQAGFERLKKKGMFKESKPVVKPAAQQAAVPQQVPVPAPVEEPRAAPVEVPAEAPTEVEDDKAARRGKSAGK